MKPLSIGSTLLCIGLISGAFGLGLRTDATSNAEEPLLSTPSAEPERPAAASPDTVRYQLDASQRKFIAHALTGGLLWFKGHSHLVAVREFTGTAQLAPDSIGTASLEIVAKAGSMVETSDVFTEAQKQIINKELTEIVLEPAKYPDITFRSTSITGKAAPNGEYELEIRGDLTLHGVTRPITIPTRVTVTGNDLRAQGKFSIHRSDFKVKATSAVHGLVRVRNKVKFTFDILGHRS